MSETLKNYYDALERLKCGRPLRVAKGVKITNDAVSLEAGRKKGTIKKSRVIFKDLIDAINEASAFRLAPKELNAEQLSLAKEEIVKYRILWEEALGREVSLINQLWRERDEWAREKSALTGEKVSSILSRKLSKKKNEK